MHTLVVRRLITMNIIRFLIVVFPGQGHINPGFQLAKRLLAAGAEVTFLSGSSAINRISITDLPPGFTFATFPDESFDFRKNLKQCFSEIERCGSKTLAHLITDAIQSDRPYTCLLYATLLPWARKIARDNKVPSALLWLQPVSVLSIYYHYFNDYGDAMRDSGNNPVDLPGLPPLRASDLPSFLLDSESAVRSVFEKHTQVFIEERKDKVLVNSFQALESDAMKGLPDLNLIPVGPLIPSPFLLDRNKSYGADTGVRLDFYKTSEGCIEWLHTKAESSVIYVSFGSYSVLPKSQMEELASALAKSGNAFLWVCKEMEGEVMSCREELERNGGMMVNWCSQLEVLSHPSVGCFVTHCGWNSSLESLVLGVPMVGFPLWTDQPTNAKLIEDVWGVGVRAARDDEGLVREEEIGRCLEIVMGGGEKAGEIRRNSLKWKEAASEAVREGGSSDESLKGFVDWVKQGLSVD